MKRYISVILIFTMMSALLLTSIVQVSAQERLLIKDSITDNHVKDAAAENISLKESEELKKNTDDYVLEEIEGSDFTESFSEENERLNSFEIIELEEEEDVKTYGYTNTGWQTWYYGSGWGYGGYVSWAVVANALYIDMAYADYTMPSVSYYWDVPWSGYLDNIRFVFVEGAEEGISFCPWAFFGGGMYDFSLENETDMTFLDECFRSCLNLEEVNLSSPDICFYNSVFLDCNQLQSIKFDNCESLGINGKDCFKNCSSLKEIDLSNMWGGIVPIGTFNGCSALITVSLPKDIETICTNAFYGCDSLKDIYFKGSKEEWEKIVIEDGNEALKKATIHFGSTAGKDDNENEDITTIDVDGAPDRAIYYWDEYNPHDFTLDLDIRCAYSGNVENAPVFNNVCVEVNLEDGLSFSDAETVLEYNKNIGTLSASTANLSSKKISIPVFIKTSDYNESFSTKVFISADDLDVKEFRIEIPVKKYEIDTYSSNPSGLMGLDQTAVFIPQLYINGIVQNDEQGWKFDVEDADVIKIDKVDNTDVGMGVRIISVNTGFTYLNILHVPSAKLIKIPITVANGSKRIDISELKEKKKFVYNKILIENFASKKTKQGYQISFDAYNYLRHIGAVEIYDANDHLIKIYPIEKFEDYETDLRDVFKEGVNIIVSCAYKTLVKDENSLYCKHTPIDVSVPEGGYIIISNDVDESLAAGLYNLVDISYEIFSESYEWGKKITKGDLEKIKQDSFKSISDQLIAFLVNNNYDKTLQEAYMKKLSKDITKSLSKDVMVSFSCQLLTESEDYLGEMNINLQEEATKSIEKMGFGVAEDFFTEAAGPAGIGLKILFEVNKALNLTGQAIDMSRTSYLGELIISVGNDYGDKVDKSIIVTYEDNSEIEDADLIVVEIRDKASHEYILSEVPGVKDFKLWDISLYRESCSVQPDRLITIRIPVPNGYYLNKCKIFRQEKDGKLTDMNAYYENGFMVFKTNHLSCYALCEFGLDKAKMKGDVTRDGYVAMDDVVKVARAVAGSLKLTDEEIEAADVTGDGYVAMDDVVKEARYVAGSIKEL